jgi:hypothetical protein
MQHYSTCPEQVDAGRRMAEAINHVYAALAEIDAAKAKNAPTELIDALYVRLYDARAAERAANESFREHRDQHGC